MTTAPTALAALALAAAWALAVTVVDVRTMRIPGPLAWCGVVPAVAVALAAGRPLPALAGAAGSAALYLLLRLVSSSGLGGGDLRLAPTVGALSGVAGPAGWALACVGAFVLTAVAGLLVLSVGRGSGRTTRVPHGPAMVLSALVVTVPALTGPALIG